MSSREVFSRNKNGWYSSLSKNHFFAFIYIPCSNSKSFSLTCLILLLLLIKSLPQYITLPLLYAEIFLCEKRWTVLLLMSSWAFGWLFRVLSFTGRWVLDCSTFTARTRMTQLVCMLNFISSFLGSFLYFIRCLIPSTLPVSAAWLIRRVITNLMFFFLRFYTKCKRKRKGKNKKSTTFLWSPKGYLL